jgi:hypothetical protein
MIKKYETFGDYTILIINYKKKWYESIFDTEDLERVLK